MKKAFAILAAFMLCGFIVKTQVPDWTRVLQVNTYGLQSINLVTADANNIYIAGTISGPITYDGSEFLSIGATDMLITKVSNGGSTEWVKQFNAQAGGTITPLAIKTDASGNVFVEATFIGTINFGDNTFSSELNNAFLAKFDNSGTVLWATPFEQTYSSNSKIAIEGNGNCYLIAGTSKLLKFSSSGAFLWEQLFPQNTLQAIAVYENDLFIGGSLQGRNDTIEFGTFSLKSSNAYNTAFLARADLNGVYNMTMVESFIKAGYYNTTGTFNHPSSGIREIDTTRALVPTTENSLTTTVADLTSEQSILNLKINADNTVTVTGFIYGTQPIYESGTNAYDPNSETFTLNYSYEGDGGTRVISEILEKTYIHRFNKYGSSISDITIESSGDIIITGAYTVDKNYYYNPDTAYYTFIGKCNRNFDFAWNKSSSSFQNPNHEMHSYKVFTDNSNNIYEYGMIQNSFSFGALGIILNKGDQFLIKFDSEGNPLKGYSLQNSSDRSAFVNQASKIIIGGTFAENSTSYGNCFVTQYNNNLVQDWQKVSSNSHAGITKMNFIKHDNEGNSYIRSRNIGYCDHFGTIINSNKYVTVISKLDVAGNLIWVQQIEDIGPYLFGASFTLDKDDNALTSGFFKGSLTIGSTTLTTTNTEYEGYVAKYSSTGTLLWAKALNIGEIFTNLNGELSITIAPDNIGNIIVSGVLNPAIYLVKFDASGNKLWAKSFPMEAYYNSLVSTDANNNIYVTTEIYLDYGSGTTTIGNVVLNQTDTDGSTALIKFDPNGNALWANTYGGLTIAYGGYRGWACDIKTDPTGNSYLWGWCNNNAIFGTTVLSNPFATNQNLSYYLAKINTSGDVLWAQGIYEIKRGFNYGNLLDLDKNGNIYIGGHYKDKINIEGLEYMPEGTNDFFAAKYSNSGDFKWIKTIPANKDIIKALSVYDEDVLSISGAAGLNTKLGSFDIQNKGGSNGMIATLGNLPLLISENEGDNYFIYPNPTNNSLFVDGATENATIIIYDISGKLLFSKQITSNQIDISRLPSGIYALRIETGKGMVTKKFVKQ